IACLTFSRASWISPGKVEMYSSIVVKRFLSVIYLFISFTGVGLISLLGTRDEWLPVSRAYGCVPNGSPLSRGDRRGGRLPPGAHGQWPYEIRRADPPARLVGRG